MSPPGSWFGQRASDRHRPHGSRRPGPAISSRLMDRPASAASRPGPESEDAPGGALPSFDEPPDSRGEGETSADSAGGAAGGGSAGGAPPAAGGAHGSPSGGQPEGTPEAPTPSESVLEAAERCKALLDPQTQDQQRLWWDAWAKRWAAEFEPSGRIRDEEAETLEARRVRKMCKEAKIPKDETAQRVQAALAQLAFEVPPCPRPKMPQVVAAFPKEQGALHDRLQMEAGRRLNAIKHKQELDAKSDDESAISKATLADAKLQVMGKKPHFLSQLRLPASHYVRLKQGTGVRKGVTNFMGDLLEEYRQKQTAGGALVLRQKEVDDEWAAQIGKAIALGIGHLHSLDLANNNVGNSGVRDLAIGMSRSTTLTSLNLSFNHIDREGLNYLADSLLVNTTITELSLNSIKFGAYLKTPPKLELRQDEVPHDPDHDVAEGSEADKEAEEEREKEEERERERQKEREKAKAKEKRRRRLLGLPDPPETPPPRPEIEYQVGLGRMLDTLIATKTLCTLDLAGNRMGPVLFGQLCESLSLNQTVRWFSVAGNYLGPDGGAHLGRLLSVTNRIQYIDASGNFFGPEGADYMSLQIDTNTGLTGGHSLESMNNQPLATRAVALWVAGLVALWVAGEAPTPRP